jgi:hypothetical protein
MPDCRKCQFFSMWMCDKFGQVPQDKICNNPCKDFVELPDAVEVLTNWIAQGAPAHAKTLLDCINFVSLKSLDGALPWLLGLRDTVEKRSILYHFPGEAYFEAGGNL